MKRILLLGRTGQIGWELHRSLLPVGNVVAWQRTDADLDDLAALQTRVREVEPDVIVNAAAYTAVDRAESEPDRAWRLNGEAPGVLAEEARRRGALLVHFSTDYVFDGAKTAPYLEADEPNPVNAYGRSKLAGERAIRASGCRHLILRTSWVYAARGHNFVRTILRLAQEREVLRIVADQTGAPTWARSIADTTALLLANPRLYPAASHRRGDLSAAKTQKSESSEEGVWGIYHLTAAGATSWHGFAAAILERLAQRLPANSQRHTARLEAIPTIAYPLPAARPANSRLNCDKLIAGFGLRLPHWQTGVDLCLADIVDRSPK